MTDAPAPIADVRIEDAGEIRLLVLDRSERRNALTVGTVDALRAAVTGARGAGARAVVIAGEGPSFCAGGDLPSLQAIAAEGSAIVSDAIYTSFHGLVRAIRDAPVPVIAAVNGHALGAGLDLALSCDLRYAAPDAQFESTWLKVGLIPGMAGAHRLPEVIGSGRAAEMLLLGRRVDAETALAWGLVNGIAADGDVRGLAVETARRLALLPPLALQRTKAAFRRRVDHGLEEEFATLGAQQGQLLTSPEFAEATARLSRRS
ncbi:enoyl-CoA hydratase/isomerase family protein [Microbacterium sp. No. 7]|uniref:enoyl-CoA hydratase/isomerase family protein n=1 Tax=Microbacterium sp. No. 7 TaxID=1714373 RepID=UPI0006D000CF|nr:enoyl-CoA hydratase/isomerase family protein [Microbacterium sp. No. 7]